MAEGTRYPKRESHFAHRAVRLMHKTCLAQEIGPDAVFLLTVIAHQEDSKRYAGPVTFYNAQLQAVLGFAKWERLDNARTKAINDGWLHYETTGKRAPGLYWVTIPDSLSDVCDAPLDEGLYPLEGYKQGYKDGYKAGVESVKPPEDSIPLRDINRGYKPDKPGMNREQGGIQTGDEQGEPSTLIPSPIPDPNPEERFAAQSESQTDGENNHEGGGVVSDEPPTQPKKPGGYLFARYVELWNSLPPGTAPKIARPDSPSLAKSWANAWRNPEIRELLKKPDEVFATIRASPACHGQAWFCFAWILKRENGGSELNLLKLMGGRYRERFGKKPADRTGAGKIHQPDAAAGDW